MYKTIDKILLKSKIKSLGGKIFTVTFRKKDGTVRVMNCRNEVTKHLKDGPKGEIRTNTTELNNPNLKVVFDLKAKGYRTINYDTVTQLRADGVTYEIAETLNDGELEDLSILDAMERMKTLVDNFNLDKSN